MHMESAESVHVPQVPTKLRAQQMWTSHRAGVRHQEGQKRAEAGALWAPPGVMART